MLSWILLFHFSYFLAIGRDHVRVDMDLEQLSQRLLELEEKIGQFKKSKYADLMEKSNGKMDKPIAKIEKLNAEMNDSLLKMEQSYIFVANRPSLGMF